MLQNSVANNFKIQQVLTLTGVTQTITLSTGAGGQGLLSVLMIADVDFHFAKAGPATTSDFLILANTYFEIPVADLKTFEVISVGAGSFYLLEWLG